jgi:hypothetical protein
MSEQFSAEPVDVVVDLQIVYNDLPRIARRLPASADVIVRKTAFMIKGIAQGNVRVDTGAAKNSIYVISSTGNGFSAAVRAAAGAMVRRGAGARQMLFQAPPVDRTRKGAALVVVGVSYGYWIEYVLDAYLTPAAEEVKSAYVNAMKGVFDDG